jgi:uncharacterized UBP type Zn finger protein
MKNTGNSCYFNSVIQTLINLPSFYSDLTNKRLIAAELTENSFVKCLTDIAINLQGNTINPASAQRAISRHCKQFANKKQQDAHELFGSCLNIIEKELLPFLKGLRGNIEDCALSDKPLLFCPTKRNFSFIMQKEFICTNCSVKSQLKEIFRDISLELGGNPHHYYNLRNREKRLVSGLLANYFIQEKLERLCENCQCPTASVEKKIFTLPRVLVIHIKRFQHTKTGFFVHKLHDKITIDSKIDIKSYGRDAQYPIQFNKETELSESLKKKKPSQK